LAARTTHDFEGDEDDPQSFPLETIRYAMLECCGCETISLRYDYTFLPTNETETRYYPPRVFRRPPTWVNDLPKSLTSLFREVYRALADDSRTLAAMGARTLVDMVILEKVGDRGTFAQKLQALEGQGLIGRLHREQLEAALDAGSAAAHRGFAPSAKTLGQVMDIVENLLQAVYVLSRAASELKKGTPPRGGANTVEPAV
jgi:hypothetical protein